MPRRLRLLVVGLVCLAIILGSWFGGVKYPRGMPAGLVAIQGSAGSGKTTVGLHFLSECDEDNPGVYFGFYETPAAILDKATALGLPPFNLWPVPFLTFPLLVWLIDGCGAVPLGGVLTAAGIGWWFGFGYFLAGLYWVGNAFLVDLIDDAHNTLRLALAQHVRVQLAGTLADQAHTDAKFTAFGQHLLKNAG